MNTINFEGIGLSFKVNSIALDFYGIKIYWYAIFIVIGFITAFIFSKIDDGKYNIKFQDILELSIFIIPISIISARAYYVLFKFDLFNYKLIDIINIKNGGLAIYGGIIGAIATIFIFSKLKKIYFLDLLDYLIPFLPLGQSIGRWGNFFNIEAYGYETSNFFRMGIIENGNYIQVHPTFLYESICTLIIFFILFNYRNKRKYSGQITLLYFLMYGIVRTIIEGLRTDSLMIYQFRVSQLLSIFLAITSGMILVIKRWNSEKTHSNRSNNSNTGSDN